MLMRLLAACLVMVVGLNSSVTAQQMPTPSEEHEILMQDVGEWTIKGKMLMPEGVQEFEGEEKVVAIGGFWTVTQFSSDMFGGMEGSATTGYDPETRQFVGTWVDSFQPTPTRMKGTYDDETQTLTFDTSSIGMDGKPMAGKIIVKYIDANTHAFTMLHKDPTGQTDEMVTTLEMTYTRKSG